MARISDFMTSSRDTSPDPITLPSSPLGSHSPRKLRSNMKPSARKPVSRMSASPSKQMILDTPQAGDGSPWRIKVTVEAEPREGSPGKRIMRTTTVPLKESPSKRSSSPTKRAASQQADRTEIKRPVRKRKGTPIRDKRPQRPYVAPEPEPSTEEDDIAPPASHTPARRASGRLARLNSYNNSTRSKRLSVAREELDYALQDAAGRRSMRGHTPGDRTVSLNEDFSIISVDSLQTAKETSMANVMQAIPELDKSTASIPHGDISSAKVQYPNIEEEVVEATTNNAYHYDPMSWKPTGPAKGDSPQSFQQPGRRTVSAEERWENERRNVVREAERAESNGVVVVDDAGEDEEESDEEMEGEQAGMEDADIWQTEASRSLEEEHEKLNDEPQEDLPRRSPQLEDLFAGQPLRPARSKIPRTWRRSSGMDFSYVDSPAHEIVAQQTEGRRNSTDGSGVLTPPSTDEEDEEDEDEEEDEEEDEKELQKGADVQYDDPESEFQPEAEATRFHDHELDEDENELMEEEDEVEDEKSSSEDDDTGNFFANNMPQVFNKERPRRRPPQQKTMDLTELLNLDAESPKKSASDLAGTERKSAGQAKSSPAQKQPSPLHVGAKEGQMKNSPQGQSQTHAVNSPLRKSLLRSSKVQDGAQPVDQATKARRYFAREPPLKPFRPLHLQDREEDITDSFASKASDQRQLLREASASKPRQSQHIYVEEEEINDSYEPRTHEDGDHEDYEEEYDNEETDQPIHSYEENLNKDSPQKIRVNFNDSRTQTHSSLLDLTHRKEYPPLFGPPKSPIRRVTSPPTITLVSKKPEPQPNLLTRLSTTFWSAVVRPQGPTEVLPQPKPEPQFPVNLRAQLRARYGVVCDSFPWTMHHIRSLHRMLNSLTSNPEHSIIPNIGPLPSVLTPYINTHQTSITSYRWPFTRAQAYVVWSFFQVLVPQQTIEAMERGEIEWLGDELARKCRGYYGERHGSEAVWVEGVHDEAVCNWVDGREGRIDVEFVVRALGTCVDSNVQLEERSRGKEREG